MLRIKETRKHIECLSADQQWFGFATSIDMPGLYNDVG